MKHDDIHSCHFGCQRPACVLRQRDQLWGLAKPIYEAMCGLDPKHRWTFDYTMQRAAEELMKIAAPSTTCPPCNNNCKQGRECPANKAAGLLEAVWDAHNQPDEKHGGTD